MIVHFNTLAPVKKEASFLRKLIKKHIQDARASLTDIQDIVASMYGWENYNRLSQAHDDMVSQSSNRYGDVDYMKTHKIKTVNMLEPMERKFLEVQKRVKLSEALGHTTKNTKGIEATVYEFFDRKSKVDAFFGLSLHSSELERVKSLSNLPSEMWKRHSLFHSNDSQDVAKFIIDVPLAQAILGGGTFVLRESVANEVFDAIDSILEDKSRLKSFYVGRKDYFKRDIHTSSCRFDPLSVGSSDHEIATRIGFAFEHKTNNPSQKTSHERATALYLLMYETGMTIQELFTSLNSIENIYEKAVQSYLNSKSDDNKHEFSSVIIGRISPLVHTKLFVKNDTSELTAKEQEDLSYSLMVAYGQLKELVEAPAANNSYVDLMDSFHGNSINIFVIPEYSCASHENHDTLITTTLRMLIAPALGYLSEESCKNSTEKKEQAYKPLFLDASSNLYNIRGFAVVAAQARSLGLAMFYCLSEFTLKSPFNDEQEEGARFASTATKIYTSIDFAPHLVKDIEKNRMSYIDLPRDEGPGASHLTPREELKRIEKMQKQSAIQLAQGKTVFLYQSGVFYTEE